MIDTVRDKRILILDPSPPAIRGGNRVTALRWALLLRELGAHVSVRRQPDTQPYDLRIALHAVKNAASVKAWRERWPHTPIVVALTGTDFQSGSDRGTALASLATADRIIVLFEEARRSAFEKYASKTVAIPQSFTACVTPEPSWADGVRFCLLANLRPVKDPLLATRALGRIREHHALRLIIVGGVLDETVAREVQAAQERDARIQWVGSQRRQKALEILAASHVLLCTSRHEGGAGTVGEALALDRAVLSTDLAACRALLGDDHPGLFPVGDAVALARLMDRYTRDEGFRAQLKQATRTRAHLVSRDLERERWRSLLADIF